MTLAKAAAEANRTFIANASLTIVTYNRKNIFMLLANGQTTHEEVSVVRFNDRKNHGFESGASSSQLQFS